MKFQSIQYLRALAAVGVVLFHASRNLLGDRALIPFAVGQEGVDLFFVISGFIMFYTTAGERMAPDVFLVRRLIRIVPLYFLFTTLAFVLALAMPSAIRSIAANPGDYLRSLLFIPYLNPKLHRIWPMLVQGWTLNYEMFFYLVFAICLFLRRDARLLCGCTIFLLLSVIGFIAHPASPILATYTSAQLLEFAYGMLIGYVVSARPHRLVPLTIVFAIAAAVSVFINQRVPAFSFDNYPFLVAGIPAAAIVCLALWLEIKGWLPNLAALTLAGDASYSLYLSHVFMLAGLRQVWKRFDVNQLWTHASFMATGIAAAIAFSLVVYLWIERPLTRWLLGRARRWQAQRELVTTAPGL